MSSKFEQFLELYNKEISQNGVIRSNSEFIEWFITNSIQINQEAHTWKPLKLMYSMFTFTLKDDEQATYDKALAYILNIPKRSESLGLHYIEYVEELTEKGRPHFHLMIGSTRSVPPDAFKQYSKNYGFVHKSKKVTQFKDGIDDYIKKEGETKIIMNKLV